MDELRGASINGSLVPKFPALALVLNLKGNWCIDASITLKRTKKMIKLVKKLWKAILNSADILELNVPSGITFGIYWVPFSSMSRKYFTTVMNEVPATTGGSSYQPRLLYWVVESIKIGDIHANKCQISDGCFTVSDFNWTVVNKSMI